MDERQSLRVKGRVAEVLEGGKVLRQDLSRELKGIQETADLSDKALDEILDEMLLDETVRKIIREDKGVILEYWELNE